MNPILQSALGSIIRAGLLTLTPYIVKHGIWTDTEALKYVEASIVAILALGWSLWEKYRSRIKFLTALTMPVGATENDVKAHISSGATTPAVTTPPHTEPGVPK